MENENKVIKGLEETFEAPIAIKSNVKGSLSFLRFMFDVVDVYVVQAGSAAAGFMEAFEVKDTKASTDS